MPESFSLHYPYSLIIALYNSSPVTAIYETLTLVYSSTVQNIYIRCNVKVFLPCDVTEESRFWVKLGEYSCSSVGFWLTNLQTLNRTCHHLTAQWSVWPCSSAFHLKRTKWQQCLMPGYVNLKRAYTILFGHQHQDATCPWCWSDVRSLWDIR